MRQRKQTPQPEVRTYPLPIAKLHGVPALVQRGLKALRITTCSQLLAAAGKLEEREALARSAQIAPELLLTIVQRADLARIKGIGVRFGQLLEGLGVLDVAVLARQNPQVLHEQLQRLNTAERLTRRSPTPAEVEDWVSRARSLPILVHHLDQASTVSTLKAGTSAHSAKQ